MMVIEPPRITRKRELEAELKENIIPQLVKLGAVKIILHGSVAGDQVWVGSDIDLIVVAESDLNFKERMFYFSRELKSKEPVEMFVYTPGEFERMLERSSFIRQATQEGRVVYDAEKK
jgi:predicted nucleotidyltransferase